MIVRRPYLRGKVESLCRLAEKMLERGSVLLARGLLGEARAYADLLGADQGGRWEKMVEGMVAKHSVVWVEVYTALDYYHRALQEGDAPDPALSCGVNLQTEQPSVGNLNSPAVEATELTILEKGDGDVHSSDGSGGA